MQPENLTNITGPEKMPSMPRPEYEHLLESNTENTVEKSAEKFEQRSESNAVLSDVGNTTLAAVTDDVTNNNTVVDEVTTPTNTPMIAGNEDLIEREWVDRAKKIISDTKEDPYARDKEVSKLQVEYIKKRYGRSISLGE